MGITIFFEPYEFYFLSAIFTPESKPTPYEEFYTTQKF